MSQRSPRPPAHASSAWFRSDSPGAPSGRPYELPNEALDHRDCRAAWRVGYVLVTKRTAVVWGDSVAYHDGANLLASGKGFIDPLRYQLSGRTSRARRTRRCTCSTSRRGHSSGRRARCGTGSRRACRRGNGGLVGLLGRRLAGDRAGLIAALLAAAYPHLWLNDAASLSETAAAFVVVLATLTVERFREQPTYVCTLAAGWRGRARGARSRRTRPPDSCDRASVGVVHARARAADRLLRVGAVGLVAVVLIGPWVGYNLSRFEKPVLLSNGFGATRRAVRAPPPFTAVRSATGRTARGRTTSRRFHRPRARRLRV